MEHATFKRAILYVAGLLLFTAVMGFATSDSCTFARMYMSVNNQVDGDHTYQAIHVSPCNPMQICTDIELVASLQNGYTGYIYLGSPRCPYCRNTVPLLLEQAQTSGISRILSCTLQNYNYRYEYTDAGLIETQHGTPAYDTLLQLLDAYTAPKRIAAPDGQTVDTGVRTIYMPAVLHCTNGIPDRCWQYSSTGITLDAGQSAYDPWTPAQQLLAKESLQEFLRNNNSMIQKKPGACGLSAFCCFLRVALLSAPLDGNVLILLCAICQIQVD
jgi:hypothetical protein